jgi:hypothetical protein
MKTPGPNKNELQSRLRGYSLGYSPTQSGSFAGNAVVSTQSAGEDRPAWPFQRMYPVLFSGLGPNEVRGIQ